MKDRINTYFAVLLITLAGAGAAWFIVRIADRKAPVIRPDTEASYAPLKESILKQ